MGIARVGDAAAFLAAAEADVEDTEEDIEVLGEEKGEDEDEEEDEVLDDAETGGEGGGGAMSGFCSNAPCNDATFHSLAHILAAASSWLYLGGVRGDTVIAVVKVDGSCEDDNKG